MKRGKFYQIKGRFKNQTREAVEYSGYIDEENQIGYYKIPVILGKNKQVEQWSALDIATGLSVIKYADTTTTRRECEEKVRAILNQIYVIRNESYYPEYINTRKILVEAGKPMTMAEIRSRMGQ